jgi:AraC-like DNA-binding protein
LRPVRTDQLCSSWVEDAFLRVAGGGEETTSRASTVCSAARWALGWGTIQPWMTTSADNDLSRKAGESGKTLVVPCNAFRGAGRYLDRRNGTSMIKTADTKELATLLSAHAPYDGEFALRLPGVFAARASRPSSERMHGIQEPSACIVVAGAKNVLVGEEIYQYESGQVAVYSVDVPLSWQITRASQSEPYLVLKISLNAERIVELAARVFPHGIPQPKDTRALYVTDADAHLLDAARRLVELMSSPADAALLAPLAVDEILIRLLRSPMGSRIAQLGQTESSLHRVSTAVAWLRENFDQTVNVDDLAKRVNMSGTNFHRQFKLVTSMSPLQYQKALRLQEARRLMLTRMLDAGAAGRQVGYSSPSQFTREYGRFFGTPPTRDIQRLREHGLAAPEAGTA